MSITISTTERKEWTPNKNRGGRYVTVHEARLGEVYAIGLTAAAAKRALLGGLATQLANVDFKPRVLTVDGYVVVIQRRLPTAVLPSDGVDWGYSIERPDEGELTTARPSCFGYGSPLEAEEAARRILAQSLFRPDAPERGCLAIEGCADPDVRARLRAGHERDVNFQLRYRALAASGLGDNDSHRIAGGLDSWPAELERPTWSYPSATPTNNEGPMK